MTTHLRSIAALCVALLAMFAIGLPAQVSQTPGPFVLGSGAFTPQLFGPVVGNCTTPAYSFAGDGNTGYGASSTETLVLCTAGTERIQISNNIIILGSGAASASIRFNNAPTLGFGTSVFMSGTAPTISSGFGTSPSVVANNGTAAFTINVGTGGTASTGVIGLPAATTGWHVQCQNTSTNTATVFITKQTGATTTTATIGNYDAAGAAAAWVASNVLLCSATGY
jgi:hypothetical protein